MKVRELLKDFYGDTKIQIREAGTDETHECKKLSHARLEYGHYEVSNWHMEDDVLDILIQPMDNKGSCPCENCNAISFAAKLLALCLVVSGEMTVADILGINENEIDKTETCNKTD